jgi:hypothetical protein
MDSRKERLELIREIQESRGSKVLVRILKNPRKLVEMPQKYIKKRVLRGVNQNPLMYFTGDRRPFSSQIAEDAVLPLYKHLLALTVSPNLKTG